MAADVDEGRDSATEAAGNAVSQAGDPNLDVWSDVLGHDLVVETSLPMGLASEPLPSTEVTARLMDVLALVEQGLLSARERRSDEELDSDLARIELKVDLLVQLVVAQQRPEGLPWATVRVSRRGMVIDEAYELPWARRLVTRSARDATGAEPGPDGAAISPHAGMPSAGGDDLRALAVAVSPALPWPCVIPVESALWRGRALGVRFSSNSATLDEALGRWVFRLHRRQVALARSRRRSKA
ncbi:MAG: PilZ domain-containing protein [Thioalkalivibrionaceae bacterium]